MEQGERDTDLDCIIESVQAGDKQAYVAIIERFQRPIYLYCHYVLRNQEEAEDAAQDTFFKAYKHLSTYASTNSFSAWLYKIAKNTCVDRLRKRNKDRKLAILYRDHHLQEEKPQYEDFIYECLDKLTDEERQILLLRSLEEYSYDEIAFILDSKPSTVRKRYERIRKKLINGNKRGVDLYGHTC